MKQGEKTLTMLQKLFGFDPAQHKVRTEIYAGITTFHTMAYSLAVNPGIFSALEPIGMPSSAVFTATVLASVVGSLVMAFFAKKPFGLAPGMGINAFFVYTVCLGMGYSWQFALTAVFIEGILFILLSLFKVRELIANAIGLVICGLLIVRNVMWVLFVVFVLRYVQRSL